MAAPTITHVTGGQASTTSTITAGSTTYPSGRLILAICSETNSTTCANVSSITLTGGTGGAGTWTRRSKNQPSTATGQSIEVWWADSAAGGTQTLTITFDRAIDDAIWLMEVTDGTWDTNASLPALLAVTSATATAGISTDSSAPAILIHFAASSSVTSWPTATPSGITELAKGINSGGSKWQHGNSSAGAFASAFSSTTTGMTAINSAQFNNANVTIDALTAPGPPTGTISVPLGPLTVASSASSFTPYGYANINPSVEVRTVGYASLPWDNVPCIRQAWLTLGSLTLNLQDEAAGYFCTNLDVGYPEPRSVVNNRPDRDGTIDRTRYMAGRAVTAEISAIKGAGADIDVVAASFAKFMAPSARPVLHYVLDRPGAVERTLTLRAAGYSWPIQGNWQRDIQLQWVAPDPVAYDPVQKTVLANTGIVGTIVTPGDVPVRPLIRLTGPVTHPVIKLVPSDSPVWYLAFKTAYTLAAGNWVDIDIDKRTIYLRGDPAQSLLNVVDWTQTSWQWMAPAPSSTDMSLTGTAISGATKVEAFWQDGYLT